MPKTQEMEQEMTQESEQQMPQSEEEENLLADDPFADAYFDRFKEDGKVNVGKLAKSYRALEKKLSSGELPPESFEEYGDTEGIGDIEMDKAILDDFKKKAHAAGYTKKQLDLALQEFGGLVRQGKEIHGKQQETAKGQTKKALQDAWGDKYEYELENARRAFRAISGEEEIANSALYAESAPVMKMMAKLGANLKEDTPASHAGGTIMENEDLQAVMKSEAYWNPKHPEHARALKKVTQHFEAKNRK